MSSNNIFYYRGPGKTIWKTRFPYTKSRITSNIILEQEIQTPLPLKWEGISAKWNSVANTKWNSI